MEQTKALNALEVRDHFRALFTYDSSDPREKTQRSKPHPNLAIALPGTQQICRIISGRSRSHPTGDLGIQHFHLHGTSRNPTNPGPFVIARVLELPGSPSHIQLWHLRFFQRHF